MYENLIHSFRIDHAKEYGIEEAILIQYFSFWIEKNEANLHNCKEGSYWTYMSFSGLEKLFPYMSGRTIKRKIQRLRELGILLVKNFNTDQSGASNWYSLASYKLSQCPSVKLSLGLCQSVTRPVPICHPPYNTVHTSNNTVLHESLETKTLNKVLKQSGAVAAKEPKESSPHPEVIAYFVNAFQDKTGNKYVFTGADAVHISNLLKVTDKTEIMKRIDVFFASNDPFYKTVGYTSGLFYKCFNKLNPVTKPLAKGAAGREL